MAVETNNKTSGNLLSTFGHRLKSETSLCTRISTITTTTQTTTATIGWKILSAQARTTVSAQALKLCEE